MIRSWFWFSSSLSSSHFYHRCYHYSFYHDSPQDLPFCRHWFGTVSFTNLPQSHYHCCCAFVLSSILFLSFFFAPMHTGIFYLSVPTNSCRYFFCSKDLSREFFFSNLRTLIDFCFSYLRTLIGFFFLTCQFSEDIFFKLSDSRRVVFSLT